MKENQAVVLVKRPVGDATPDCFELQQQPVSPLADGQIRVAVEYISVDAGTRTMLQGEGFHRQVALGGGALHDASGDERRLVLAAHGDGGWRGLSRWCRADH